MGFVPALRRRGIVVLVAAVLGDPPERALPIRERRLIEAEPRQRRGYYSDRIRREGP